MIPAFQQLIPNEWVEDYSSEYKDLRLKNGSLIHFQTLEDPDQGRGQGLDWLWIDEVCELTVKHWEVIRPSLAGDTVAFFTTSPRGYDWVYKELYKPAEDGLPGYWACHAKTSESANPRVSQEFLARERSQMSETMYRQEYEADFVIFTGAVYGDSINSQILRSDDDIRRVLPEWPEIAPWRQVLVGIDTGADHPFGATKIVSTEKGLVVVGEYLERHRSFATHAGEIKRLASYHRTVPTQNSPRYGINKNERQPMIELAQHGIYCQGSENDVVAGTERVKSWLEAKQLWFVEREVPKTIQQMKSYRWAENTNPKDSSKRVEKVYKVEDELPDCLRYSVMTWPILPLKPPVEDNKPRDITNLPEKVQHDIQRIRKTEAAFVKSQQVVADDFWG